ncbi:MAG TPA: hypothetical protein VIS29_03210 [Streptomyces sp.]|jgi:hypothetical protein
MEEFDRKEERRAGCRELSVWRRSPLPRIGGLLDEPERAEAAFDAARAAGSADQRWIAAREQYEQ